MDPNETLKAIRELIDELHSGELSADEPSALAENLEAHLDALASTVEALDEWLSKGGFLPAAWDDAPGRSVRLVDAETIENIAGEAGLAIVGSDVKKLADMIVGVQYLNTADAAGPTDKGPCTATVRVNTKTMPCELDAPHPGWAHTNIDSRRTIHWCSDAEAESVVVE